MFKPEQPIQSCKDDILGRSSFAQSLGNAILSYKGKDSIVIGLFGEWGSGKTSIINISLEHIESVSQAKPNNEKPVIVKFNPWNYSDQNQLVAQFFRQLSVILKRPDYAGDAQKAGKQLETYAKFFEPFALIPGINPFAVILSALFKQFGNAARSWGNLKANDLDATRTELNKLLEKQPHKIIVVVDDIDRLNNTEIRQIFQLIKSLGDFPNTIYLVAFDKTVIINALKKVQEGSGKEYLEKVIQIPFEIPVISTEEIEHLLFSQLDELIREIPENRWDQTYWGNIYHSGLKYFFRNIRDVTRYINSLRFSFEMVKDEVNVIDFLAITGIQVFIPEIYYGIRDNKDIFSGATDDFNSHRRNETIEEQTKKRCDEIISSVEEPSQEILKDFLKRLFPKLESIYGNVNYGHTWLDNWRKNYRICSPDIFDVFFKLSLPKGELSRKEIETILSAGNNPELFADALLKLNKDGRIVRFLERLEDYTQDDIPKENIKSIITVLMDIGDLFPEGDSGFFETDTPMKILRLFYQLSQRLDSHEERFNVFKYAIEKATKSLYTIVHEIGVQDEQHAKYTTSKETPEPEEKRTVNATQLEELEKLACDKIEIWAKDGRLTKHKHLPSILFRWKEWGQQEKVNNFVSNTVKSDEGLIDFIASFLSKVQSHGMSDYVTKVHWQIPLKSIEAFVDLKEIESRVRKISVSPDFEHLEDRKKLVIKTFLDTVDGKIKNIF